MVLARGHIEARQRTTCASGCSSQVARLFIASPLFIGESCLGTFISKSKFKPFTLKKCAQEEEVARKGNVAGHRSWTRGDLGSLLPWVSFSSRVSKELFRVLRIRNAFAWRTLQQLARKCLKARPFKQFAQIRELGRRSTWWQLERFSAENVFNVRPYALTVCWMPCSDESSV